MLRARLTTRGRFTIPIELRRKYDLRPGDEIDFVAEGSEIRMVRIRGRRSRSRSKRRNLL